MEINKKKLRWGLQIFSSIIILYFILKKIHLQEIVGNLEKIPISLIIYLFFWMLIKSGFQLLNWYHFLKLNKKYRTNKSEIIKTFFIGNALKFALPGGYATFGKAFFLNNSKKDSFLSVAFEKFILTWVNLLSFLIGLYYYFDEFSRIYGLIILVIFFIFPFLIPFLKRFYSKDNHVAYFEQYKSKISTTIFLQIVQKLITIYQYYLLLNFFGKITFIKNMMASFIVLGSNLIPITISGLGLRESFAMNIYPKYGISAETAVSVSLIIFFINNVIVALPGLYFIIKKTEH